MRHVVIALCVLFGSVALAQGQQPIRAEDDERWEGPPVVVDRGRLHEQLTDVNDELSLAIGKAKKDKKLVALLKSIRAELDEARDELASAPEARITRDGRRYIIELEDEGWRVMRRRYRDRVRWDDQVVGQQPQYPQGQYPQQPGYQQPQQPQQPQYPQQGQYPQQPGYAQQPPPPQQPPPGYPTGPQQPQFEYMSPPAVTAPMIDAAALRNLLGMIEREKGSVNRMRVVATHAPSHKYLVNHVQQILAELDTPADRLQAIRVLKNQVVDTQNLQKLYDWFDSPLDKERLRRILTQG